MSERHLATGAPFPEKKPGLLRVYSMLFCPYAERTRLVLAHKNIPHETVNVNLKTKPSWLFDKNPLGLVPVLELDDKVLYESTATCDWLDDVYSENRLTPSDPFRRAQDRIAFEYFSRLAGSMMAMARAETDAERSELVQAFLKHVQYYEDTLVARKDGPFFGGEKPAMLDYLIWPHFERVPAQSILRNQPDLDVTKGKFPKIAAWYQAMCSVPAVKAVMIDTDNFVRYMKSSAAGTPDYDMLVKS